MEGGEENGLRGTAPFAKNPNFPYRDRFSHKKNSMYGLLWRVLDYLVSGRNISQGCDCFGGHTVAVMIESNYIRVGSRGRRKSAPERGDPQSEWPGLRFFFRVHLPRNGIFSTRYGGYHFMCGSISLACPEQHLFSPPGAGAVLGAAAHLPFQLATAH